MRPFLIAPTPAEADNGHARVMLEGEPVIVCHCNRLTSEDIEWTVQGYAEINPNHQVSAFMVFRSCGLRPRCANCVPLIERLLIERQAHLYD